MTNEENGDPTVSSFAIHSDAGETNGVPNPSTVNNGTSELADDLAGRLRLADGQSGAASDGGETAVGSQASRRSRRSRTGGSTANSDANSGHRNDTSTKVYYRIDDEPTPYCTEVPVAADQITLGDFKTVLNRSNFTFYYKTIDAEMGGEVKVEIRDDCQPLCRSPNGQFELFLLTGDGSTASQSSHSARSRSRPMIPGPAPPLYPPTKPAGFYYNHNNRILPNHLLFDHGHRHRLAPFEDSTIYTESDARVYSDDESRVSTSTDNITSVSRQQYNPHAAYHRRRNRRQCHRRQPSRASSLSSMTETSMQLNVVTVTLNMEPVSLLGINVIGQSSSRGDNGIYVASIIAGSAAALDGRIEPGDMILEVNNTSFENLSNDQAVEELRKAVGKPGPLKLTVAKCFDGGARANYFAVPAREPVRPIDTLAWVQHTNAVRTMATGGGGNVVFMNAIPEGSEGAPTPIPGQHSAPQATVRPTVPGQLPPPFHLSTGAYGRAGLGPTGGFPGGRPPTSSAPTATSNGSGGGVPPPPISLTSGVFSGAPPSVMSAIMAANGRPPALARLDLSTDKRLVVQAMVQPNSGLEIRDRTWLKIPIPMSFLGSDLVEWLMARVEGLQGRRRDANRYATELLKARLIAHVVDKTSFSEQCYYVVGEEMASELLRLDQSQAQTSMAQYSYQQQQQQQYYLQQQQFQQQAEWMAQCNIAHSTANEYASLPPIASSPFPTSDGVGGGIWQPTAASTGGINSGPGGALAHSQANSNHSNDGAGTAAGGGNSSGGGSSATVDHRRKAVLPPAPSLSSGVAPPSKLPPGPPTSGHFFRPHQNQSLLGAPGVAARQPFAKNGGAGNYAGGDFIFQHL